MKPVSTSIIGISCLLPEANNANRFWNNLLVNRNCLKDIPANRFTTNQFSKQLDSISCTQGGFISNIAEFDRQFFGVSPNEAKQMDPQHRLALQEAWHCIEDANVDIGVLQKHTTGVFAAQMSDDYLQLLIDQAITADQFTAIGNYASSLANRVSHHFKLSGPSISINSACAGSLVAVHQARQSILSGECDYALVIAANIMCYPLKHLSFSMAGMLSRTNKCNTFAANADGYVPGEGVIAILMCNSERAEQAHHVYGTILNSGINHNAGTHSITSPSLNRQAELIQSVYQNIPIEHLDYIELHGTGTSLGDPIEYQALAQALGNQLKKECFLGSVKTSIGHLEASAGLAGLIKVLLMLQHELIVPSFDFERSNPLINLENEVFKLCTSQQSWPSVHNRPRIAGISCMGFGGVNTHLVVSDDKKDNLDAYSTILEHKSIPFLVSVNTEANLNEHKDNWLSFLASTEAKATEICLASMYSRSSLAYRFAFLATNPSKEELANALAVADFTKKQELPYLIFDALDFELSQVELTNSSSDAQAKIQLIENSALNLKQKSELCTHIALLDLLTQANIKYRGIIGTESTLYGLLFYLDCISLEALTAHLNTGSDLNIDCQRLKVPLIIDNKYLITKEYIQELFVLDTLDNKMLGRFLKQALELSQHQYTFKGLLARWQNLFKKYQIDLFADWQALIDSTEKESPYFSLNKEQFIVFIAIIASLEKLRKIWVLSYCIHDIIADKKCQDLTYLLANNILDEDDVIQGFLTDEFDFMNLASKIHLKLTELDGLPYLRSKNYSIQQQSNNSKFLKPYAQANAIYIGNNKTQIAVTQWSIITAGELEEKIKQTLVNQWRNGQDINWSIVFPHQPLRLDLPKYLFNLRESFWPSEH